MYIPTTFFGAQGAYVFSSGSKTSGLNYYNGTFLSGSQTWEYHYWGGDNNDAESVENTSGSLTIFSGSTQQANIILIGGGGGSGNVHDIYPNGIGGGGAGGVVRYNNFTLVPGQYEIVAGGGGDLGALGFPPGPINPGTPPYAAAGLPGFNSYIKLPNNQTYTPFTSSYIIAFGGSGGGAASGNAVYQSYVTASNSIPGGSNGGNAQTYSTRGANTPSTTAGVGLGGLNGLNQGNLGGGVGADSNISHLAGCSAGGGGATTPSLDITPIPNSPYYSAATTNGGDGIQLKIYPLDEGTASYYAGGGNATNCETRTSSSYGLGGGRNIVGSGGGNSVTPPGQNFSVNTRIGNAGGVYIEYPLYPPVTPNTMIYDGLTLWNSFNSISGGIYWADLSGNNNTGIINGSTLSSGSNMIDFNGIDNYIQYGRTATATPSSSMTLIWYGVYNSSSLNYDLFTKDNYADGWDTIFSYPQNKIVFRDNIGQDADLPNNYVNGNKTAYVLTVTNGSQILYKNAFKVGSATKVFNGFTASVLAPLQFGWNAQTDANYFSGSISDVLIYNRVLSNIEVISVSNYLSQNVSRPNYPTPVIPPSSSLNVEYVVVGGAGGGGAASTTGISAGGGGGGGAVISGSYTASIGNYYVSIGSGGGANTAGSQSQVFGQTAIGGGAGGAFDSNGGSGAAGGGGGANAMNFSSFGGSGGIGSAGFNGGNGSAQQSTNDLAWPGGGGGVGTAGENGPRGGNYLLGAWGGNGVSWSNGLFYGAGGGAGYAGSVNNSQIVGSTGGSSIGGNGSVATGGGVGSKAGTNPIANRGAGGAGGSRFGTNVYSPTGGSNGVVVIRYPGSGSRATGGTISFSGSYTYHTFNSSSTFIF